MIPPRQSTGTWHWPQIGIHLVAVRGRNFMACHKLATWGALSHLQKTKRPLWSLGGCSKMCTHQISLFCQRRRFHFTLSWTEILLPDWDPSGFLGSNVTAAVGSHSWVDRNTFLTSLWCHSDNCSSLLSGSFTSTGSFRENMRFSSNKFCCLSVINYRILPPLPVNVKTFTYRQEVCDHSYWNMLTFLEYIVYLMSYP